MEESDHLTTTDVGNVPQIVANLQRSFRRFKPQDVSYRKQQLENLRKMLKENREKILAALYKDLHKGETETTLMEINIVDGDLVSLLDSLDELVVPQSHPKDLLNKFNSIYLQPEPFGVVLVIAPWNYPFQLALLPLIGAIAAGNCCVVKPSELSIATSNLCAELIPQYLDPECYAVVAGGVDVSKALLQQKFDYIFYTGSTNVGRIVMKQAAENITPVTLELGGKSPVLVAPDANIDVAGRRIAWGKCLNSGQTCIAPDYVLCPRDKRDKLVEACKKAITEFYGEDPQQSKDYGRIINAQHFKRLVGLMDGTSGNVAFGGKTDESTRYISPTLVTDVATDDTLMEEEIFGPILPFVTFDDLEDAIKLINDREKPLAFYVFTESSSVFKDINNKTSAGGVCHNDTLMHSGVPSLPFGGVGQSGMGSYHGVQSFKTFSHYKPVMSTGTGLEALNKMRYPPFTQSKLKCLQWLLTPGRKSMFPWKLFSFILLVALVAVLTQTFGLPNWIYRFWDK